MKTEEYAERLIDLEARLSARIQYQQAQARQQVGEVPRDVADDSVIDEAESEDFTEAEGDLRVLHQIRDALRRIEDGTFGLCVVDGEPIEAKRLEAVPWTPYCIKHQQQNEASAALRTPSL
jgi:DnaK suppressor protein